MLHRDVDDFIVQLGDVAALEVVPTTRRKARIEHRLMRQERLRHAEIQDRRAERLQRSDKAFPFLYVTGPAADDRSRPAYREVPAARMAAAALYGEPRSSSVRPARQRPSHDRSAGRLATCAIGQNTGPAITCGPRGTQRNSNSVTIPKLPPPPRTPQKRSAFRSALACDELTVGCDEID